MRKRKGEEGNGMEERESKKGRGETKEGKKNRGKVEGRKEGKKENRRKKNLEFAV